MNTVEFEYRLLVIKFNIGAVTSSEIIYTQNVLSNDILWNYETIIGDD